MSTPSVAPREFRRFFLLLPALAAAQSPNGAITGVVRDSSRAVVPDTAITLRNVSTDQTVATTI